MNYKSFVDYIAFVANAHQENSRATAKPMRKFPSGEKNPYFTHPLWCAMMILLDTNLPESIRIPGAQALLFHDVLEDTTVKLPAELTEEVQHLIGEMTYMGGFDEEKGAVLEKPPLVQLLKLYDKTATLYDGDLPPSLYEEWTKFMNALIQTIEKNYGQLNIVILAKQLIVLYEKRLRKA